MHETRWQMYALSYSFKISAWSISLNTILGKYLCTPAPKYPHIVSLLVCVSVWGTQLTCEVFLQKQGGRKGKKTEPEYNQTSRANIHSQESWQRAEGATWHHKGANRHMWSGDILQDTWPGFYKSWQGVGERTVQTKRDLRHIANKCNVCTLFESISEQTNSSWFGAIWGNSIIGWILGATRELLLIVFGIVMALW